MNDCSPGNTRSNDRTLESKAVAYPAPNGIAGLANADGRVTIMMPHPERVFRTVQLPWHPREWGECSPWQRLFATRGPGSASEDWLVSVAVQYLMSGIARGNDGSRFHHQNDGSI